MSNNKVCYIVRGLPGSGKSRYVRMVHDETAGPVIVCSADHCFMKSGNYVFEPAKIGEAHAECKRKFVNAVTSGAEKIVVDNTNTSVLEMAPYVEIAQAFGYEIRIKEFRCSVETSLARNTHSVPENAIRYMAQNLQTYNAPPWWPQPEIIEND